MNNILNIISHQGNKIKIIMRYHSTPNRMTRIKITDHTEDRHRRGAAGASIH